MHSTLPDEAVAKPVHGSVVTRGRRVPEGDGGDGHGRQLRPLASRYSECTSYH